MSLKDAVREARKNFPSQRNASRTPADYNKAQKQFVADMVQHENPAVRAAALSNEYCPGTQVNDALKRETDPTVLRSILLSGRASNKAVLEFIESDTAKQFDNDEDIESAVVRQLGNNASNPSSDNEDDDDSIIDEE